MLGDIVESISNFFHSVSDSLGGMNALFFIALVVEVLIVVGFLVKSIFSYEAALNRALEKLNYWLFEKKVVTEENIKELNFLFKTRAPKRLCYYWQQFILFREGSPSTYLSTENLVEKPLKTSSYSSTIKNMSLISGLWALLAGMCILLTACFDTYLTGQTVAMAVSVPLIVAIIDAVFVVYLRARKNSVLNSLYQNTSLFGRFMDNACIDLPSYIDYQILFTPQEIESGQPVLREFLDYKARKEKEEFNRAKEENVKTESYDFASTGVDGSIVLDRAMRECELFLKKKERILLKISQLESALDSQRKNFDNVQKDYQTKIQASKENVDRLRQMQEETTNRIESNYYRKQQTQEIAKQEQYEQEFEQQRAKYMLEKNEGEEEIAKLNASLEQDRAEVENAMISEYQTFFDKFCKSAEKVVAKVFEEKLTKLKTENESNKEYITGLEIKLKNKPQDGSAEETPEGKYDEEGNYVYPNGTFYDKDGNYHDLEGNVYSQDGNLISKAEKKEEPEKQIVDFDDFDAFDFMTDISQKGDVYDVAQNVVKNVDDNIEIINNTEKTPLNVQEPEKVEAQTQTPVAQNVQAAEKEAPVLEEKVEREVETPIQAVKQDVQVQEVAQTAKRRGRPKKQETEGAKSEPTKSVGRPRKIVDSTDSKPKGNVGRPRKIVQDAPETEKRGRGRPKKTDANSSIEEINKRLSEEEARINELRSSLNQDLENAMNGMNAGTDDNTTRREQLIKEIDRLQNEAKQVIANNEPDDKISEINNKLEALLDEIKKLN